MKTCFKCDEPKPLNDFYKHKAMADGHLNKCKPCTIDAVAKNRAANIDHYREADRNRESDLRKASRRRYFLKVRNTERYKEMRRVSTIKYREKHPIKTACRVQWLSFIRNNEWLKRDACDECGDKYKIEAHHEDYTKPLSVKWLCKNCHGARHKEINEEIRNGVDWSSRGF